MALNKQLETANHHPQNIKLNLLYTSLNLTGKIIVKIQAFVVKADGKIVRVKILDSALSSELSRIGFTSEPYVSECYIHVLNNQEKAVLFEKLRNIGVAFSAGREWSPAEVFEYLRETEQLDGSYTRVSWQGPNAYTCTTE